MYHFDSGMKYVLGGTEVNLEISMKCFRVTQVLLLRLTIDLEESY
jgi:hypothetical protein